MELVDTHTHIYGEEFDEDRDAVVRRAKDAGVVKALLPNIDSATVDRVLGMCRQYPGFCYPMMGLHPENVNADNVSSELAIVRKALEDNLDSVVAIGEIGIDLYWDSTFLEQQLLVFDEQLRWAVEFGKPVSIHCRKGFGRMKPILDKYKDSGLRGVFHSFTADHDEADGMLAYGDFYLGINGIATFKKSPLPSFLSAKVPLERVLLETDSPYLAPVPKRGLRNETSFVKFVLDKVAEIYNLAPEEVAARTTANAVALFGL